MTTYKIKLSAILLLAPLVFNACSGSRRIQKDWTGEHNAQNSLDWAGTYTGYLPCADCQFIETELKLNEDQSFTLIRVYSGKEDEQPIEINGLFSIKKNIVQLAAFAKSPFPTMYKIEENQIRQLDMKGNKIQGALSEQYVLTKNGNSQIEDKKWKIIEINGQSVKGSAENYYIIFHSRTNRIEAKANCNVLLNSYKIQNELQLTIKPGISTMMACPDDLEQELIKVLTYVDNLSTDGQYLSLNKGRMAPLARFELVKD